MTLGRVSFHLRQKAAEKKSHRHRPGRNRKKPRQAAQDSPAEKPRQAQVIFGELRAEVSRIAAEEFVAALAAEGYFDVRARETREEKSGDHRRVADRFIEVTRQAEQSFAQGLGVHRQDVMPRVEVPRDEVRVGLLVESLLLEGHGKRIDVPGRELAHCGDDEGGVDAAAQKNSERDVAHQPRQSGLPQALPKLGLKAWLLAPVHTRPAWWPQVVLQAPERLDRDLPSFRHEAMSGGELFNFGVNTPRRREVTVEKILGHGVRIERAADPRVFEEGFDFRREYHGMVAMPVVERLFAGAVAGQDEAFGAVIPERDGDHPIQRLNEVGTLVFVEVNDHLTVRLRLEPVTAANELLAKFLVVVDLAVEDQRNVAGLAGKRLVACLEVNDAQAADGEGQVRRFKFPVAVGATMLETRRHPVDALAMRHRLERQVDDSANAAHGGNSLEASARDFPAGAGVRPTGLHLPYRAVPLGPEWLDLSSPCRQLSDVAVARHDQQRPRRRNLPQVRGIEEQEIHVLGRRLPRPGLFGRRPSTV